MIELLETYYNMVGVVQEKENSSCFLFHEKKYVFSPCYRSEEELQELVVLNQELIHKGIPTSRFMINNRNSFLTLYEKKNYVLLELVFPMHQEYNVLDMVDLVDKLVVQSKKSVLYRNEWASLWSSKIDYFEYQIGQLGKDKPIILNSFSYYVGMAENAIAYVNSTTKKYKKSVNEKVTLQHKRIGFPNLQMDYFNPLNYILDIEVRDIASYFKSLFFSSYEDLFIEVHAYLKRRKLDIYGYQLLYARLLYPSFYFDIYEKVMEEEEDESALIPIVSKANEYESFLKTMYHFISQYAPIESVSWIVNKKEL